MAKTYQLLPFRFERFSHAEYFLSNDIGEFEFLSENDFQELVSQQMDTKTSVFYNLKSKHIVMDTDVEPVIEMLATKFRTKKSILNNFTSLHMVVPTLRCNSNCIYCQGFKKKFN